MQARTLDMTQQTRSLHDLTLAVHRKLWADEARALRMENENLRQRVRALEAVAGRQEAKPLGYDEEVSSMLHGSKEEVVASRGASLEACCTRSTATCDELRHAALGIDGSTQGQEPSRSDSVLSISPCSSVSRDSHLNHVIPTGEVSTRNSGTLSLSLSLRQRLADAEQAHRRLQRENHLNQVLSEKDVQIRHLKGKRASCGLSCFLRERDLVEGGRRRLKAS